MSICSGVVGLDSQKSPKITRSDVDGVYDTIVQNMNSTVAELKTMVEQERVAEEQERLRKIQVRYINFILQINTYVYSSLSGSFPNITSLLYNYLQYLQDHNETIYTVHVQHVCQRQLLSQSARYSLSTARPAMFFTPAGPSAVRLGGQPTNVLNPIH